MRIPKNSYAWIVVVLLLVVWMLNYLDRQVIFSIFPLLQSELHVSTFQLGLLGTAFLWVYAACSPWAGHLADRFVYGRSTNVHYKLLLRHQWHQSLDQRLPVPQRKAHALPG